MKTFFTILLALPAAFAAPAYKAGRQVKACACANAAGQTKIDGYCPYIAGSNVNVDGQDYVSYPSPESTTTQSAPGVFPSSSIISIHMRDLI